MLRQQDDIGVFLVCMEGVPGAIRQCISRTRGSREVLIMRRLRKIPCQQACFPLSLVLRIWSRGGDNPVQGAYNSVLQPLLLQLFSFSEEFPLL